MAPGKTRSIVCSARNFFQFTMSGPVWWQVVQRWHEHWASNKVYDGEMIVLQRQEKVFLSESMDGETDMLDRYKQHTLKCSSCKKAHKTFETLQKFFIGATVALCAAPGVPPEIKIRLIFAGLAVIADVFGSAWLLSFCEYRNGDMPFRNRLFPEKIGYAVKIIDVLALLEDEEKFSKVSDEDAIRFCLLLSLEVIFMGRELVSVVDDVFLRMVNNLDAWNSFP
nr:pheophorbide A oxygenase, chloroplastic [Tanacetum cinerariifolium]